MLRSDAARYARWSAAVALVLGGATAAVYIERSVMAKIEKSKAPPPAPKEVEKSLSGLTFSKVDANRTVFTVQASKSTDFKGQNASLLEEVQITIFGKTGERHDTMQTRSCQFDKSKGSIACSGEVIIDLQSAADAERAKQNPEEPPQVVHVETSAVMFDRSNGIAQTTAPVRFTFPSGTGEAVGVDYRSEEGIVRLVRDVRMQLAPPSDSRPGRKTTLVAAREPVTVRGTALDFGRETRTMHLYGPAEAGTGALRLAAPKITLQLDEKFRAQKLLATAVQAGDTPVLTRKDAKGDLRLAAPEMTALFSDTGAVANVEATGGVNGSMNGAVENDDVTCNAATVEMLPKSSAPKQLNLKGGVVLKTTAANTGEGRTLKTEALRVDFEPQTDGRSSRPRRAETLSAGMIEWLQKDAKSSELVRTMVQADKLEMEFGAEGKARILQAAGNVRTERTAPGKPAQTAIAKSGTVQLASGGGWTQMEMQGGVRLQEGDRKAEAEHAIFARAAQTATLTEKAVVRDGSTETHAPKIIFMQSSGEIYADGGVRSTDLQGKASAVQLSPAASNITADRLEANSKSGRALYRGHARFWQGDAVLEANSIELQREARAMVASGSVRGVLPGVAAHESASGAPGKSKSTLWHIAAENLTYREADDKAHLENNVAVQSADLRMFAAALDLSFTRNAQGRTNGAAGARQISRAIGTGGVTVEQGQRKAAADRGEYTAADGKFVMSGGQPTLYDGSEGTTTGRQLTFFLADDTIIVDSENGSRTLTKHRVEK